MDNYQENTPVADAEMTSDQDNVPPPKDLPPKKKKMMLVIVACLVLVLIAGVAAIKLMHKPAKVIEISDTDTTPDLTEADNDDFKYEATVKITSDGFSPASLDVKPDTRVFFENSDSTSHRVLLTQGGDNEEGFDSKDAVLPGSGYAHSFFKVGTYQYHDANKPEIGGVISVK